MVGRWDSEGKLQIVGRVGEDACTHLFKSVTYLWMLSNTL